MQRFLSLVFAMTCWCICLPSALSDTDPKVSSSELHSTVGQVLDAFHLAAAKADADAYFSLLAENAVFVGTDASEHWRKQAFIAFAKPYFDKGIGWDYQPQKRHLHFSQSQKVTWFEEWLINKKYGLCRGTGVLELVGEDWFITQYHLTIPIPNKIAESVISLIQADSPDK